MQAQKNLASGMDAPDGTRTAGIQFGGYQQVMEACRDARGLNLLHSLWQDARYALRGFRRTPGFVLTVVATIALGLGLNTTVFTFFNAYVLQPLNVRDPHSLYQFTWRKANGDGHQFTWQELQDFRRQNPAFSEVLGFDRLSFARVRGRMMFGHMVTGNYFQMLGVNAAVGRTLLPGDDAGTGSTPVVVLSSNAWANKFGGDPEIVGKVIVIHGCPLEIVGVARAGYGATSTFARPEPPSQRGRGSGRRIAPTPKRPPPQFCARRPPTCPSISW
jgi:hypothetical protein